MRVDDLNGGFQDGLELRRVTDYRAPNCLLSPTSRFARSRPKRDIDRAGHFVVHSIAATQKETMPLYTYVMSYDGRTKVFQDRSSNYTGFLLAPISSSFPELKPAFGDLMRMTPKPVPGVAQAWGFTLDISGKPFNLHVVETREK